jgi:hypothetical protein
MSSISGSSQRTLRRASCFVGCTSWGNVGREADGKGCLACGQHAVKADIHKLAPHALRKTCARLCYAAGGELEQIQFLLGHVSVQTTERYLGCKQRFRNAVNDHIGLEPERSWLSGSFGTSMH